MVKKLLLVFLVAMLLIPSVGALAELPVVVDDANLFEPDEEVQIEEFARQIIDRYQVDVVVVTSSEPKHGASQAFADDYYDYSGYGIGEDGAGLLYLIDMTNRVPTISTKGVMIDYINDDRLETLYDCSNNALKAGAYGNSTLQLLTRLERFMAEGIEEGSFRYDAETGKRLSGLYNKLTKGEISVALLAGLIVMGIVVWSVKGRYQLTGSTYRYDMTNAGFKAKVSEETYLRTTVVRRAKSQSSGGSGSSGGRGSSVHTSSSGSSHGGGSGRGF